MFNKIKFSRLLNVKYFCKLNTIVHWKSCKLVCPSLNLLFFCRREWFLLLIAPISDFLFISSYTVSVVEPYKLI